jgi:hypothetical protein
MIRIDKALSARNHRLYRQSRNYTVKLDLDSNAPAGISIDIFALGDSWMLQKAYQLAKQQFDENSAEEVKMLGKNVARWNDFRVDHGLGNAFQKDLVFQGTDIIVPTNHKYVPDEYVMTEVTDAAGVSNTLRFVGTGANTYNIIDEYDKTGNTDQTPTFGQANVAYDGLDDEHDTAQHAHISGDGNEPPYDARVISNSVFYKVGTLTVNDTGRQRLSTGYFVAPAGLVVIKSTIPLANDSTVLNMEVKSGDYKGVHATSMLE